MHQLVLDLLPERALAHKVVLPIVGAGEDEELVCGMALGYADDCEIVNTFITPRVKAEDFTRFVE